MNGIGNKLQAALDYAKKGFTVIPVKQDKRPYVSWETFQKDTASENQITEWWSQYPDANLGIILKDGFVVLDIDDATLAEQVLMSSICEKTKVEETVSGGLHIWFKEIQASTRTENLRNAFGIPAEIRSEGTYIIVPPSDGYSFLCNTPILGVSNARETALEILGVKDSASRETIPQPIQSADVEDILEGTRNDSLTRYAGRLFRSKYSKGDVEAMLKGLNIAKCRPPLPDEDVITIVESIYKTAVNAGQTKRIWHTLDEILKTQPAQIDWIWEGFLARGFMTLFSGRAKVGKSTLFFDFLRHGIAGQPFLSQNTNIKGKVLILSEEHLQLCAKRAREENIQSAEVLFISRAELHGKRWKEILQEVRDAIVAARVDFLVIDTLSAFWGISNENEAPEVQVAMDELKMLAHELNIAVLVLHHLRKSEGGDGTAIRGSGALVGVVDVSLEMYRNNNGATKRRITSRSRFHETLEDIIIDRTKNGYVLLGSPTAMEKEEVKKRFLDALSDTQLETVEVIRDRMAEPKPGLSSLREIAGECRNQKEVLFSGLGVKGNPYIYQSK